MPIAPIQWYELTEIDDIEVFWIPFVSSNVQRVDYEQSLIFLRDIRVGEHASARENHLEETRRAAATIPEKNEGLLVVDPAREVYYLINNNSIDVFFRTKMFEGF